MSESKRNLAASVRERLVKLHKESGVDFQQVLSRYAVERFLYRLSVSAYAHDFVLKGAALFTLWGGFLHRETRDVDLLGFGETNVQRLREVFASIVSSPVPDDGLSFSTNIEGEPIRGLQEYGGVSMTLRVTLGSARITVRVDVGFGDSITPAAVEAEFPTLLDFPKPKLRAYPVETVVAEKLQALVTLGMANSRMKDYFDLWHIGRTTTLSGEQLRAAVTATFARRRTEFPNQTPMGLSTEFGSDSMKRTQWRAFCQKSVKASQGVPLEDVVEFLAVFLLPVLGAAASGTAFKAFWQAGGPWEQQGR